MLLTTIRILSITLHNGPRELIKQYTYMDALSYDKAEPPLFKNLWTQTRVNKTNFRNSIYLMIKLGSISILESVKMNLFEFTSYGGAKPMRHGVRTPSVISDAWQSTELFVKARDHKTNSKAYTQTSYR